MVAFFVPGAEDREHSERRYRAFEERALSQGGMLAGPKSRIFRVYFDREGKTYEATVSFRLLPQWKEEMEWVLAIVLTTKWLYIYTQREDGSEGPTIRVDPKRSHDYEHFGDYDPARPFG